MAGKKIAAGSQRSLTVDSFMFLVPIIIKLTGFDLLVSCGNDYFLTVSGFHSRMNCKACRQ